MKALLSLVLAVTLALSLTSCAKRLGANNYVSSASEGIVYEGTIISARMVTVKDDDQLGGKPGLGALGGGVAGGIGGSNIGKGKGSAAAAVGGAIAGAVIGSVIEDQLKTQDGMEYIIRLSDDSLEDSKASTQNKNYSVGGQKVSDKIKSSTNMGMKSRTISVVQGMEVQLSVGTRVFVIYNDDRARVVPATY